MCLCNLILLVSQDFLRFVESSLRQYFMHRLCVCIISRVFLSSGISSMATYKISKKLDCIGKFENFDTLRNLIKSMKLKLYSLYSLQFINCLYK